MTLAKIKFYDDHPATDDFCQEVQQGLSSIPKRIPPKYFYDERGSKLFDEICNLQEYYATRTEVKILQDNAEEIAEVIGLNCLLIELGSGSSTKVRILLDVLRPTAYIPIDISKTHLLNTARKLAEDYPWLDVHAACMDFTQTLDIPYCPSGVNKVVFFPGSSIGNFEPNDALKLLGLIVDMVRPSGKLLIGVDLKKDPKILNAAYNDAEGVTAAFNKNLIIRMNRDLGSKICLDQFQHKAFYNKDKGRVEMHLASTRDQTIQVAGVASHIEKGECIHTENSYKYSVSEFREMAYSAGFSQAKTWIDEKKLFSVHCFSFS